MTHPTTRHALPILVLGDAADPLPDALGTTYGVLVDVVETGEDVLRALSKGRYSALVVHLNVDDDIISMIRAVRSHRDTSWMPIVGVGAEGDDAKELALGGGCDVVADANLVSLSGALDVALVGEPRATAEKLAGSTLALSADSSAWEVIPMPLSAAV